LPNLEHLRQLADEHNHLGDLPTPTTLIYIDVSDFKKVNASSGRGVGDQSLRELVRQMQSNLRAADVLFRLGSDEFVVLLLQTDRETANLIATRMKGAVEAAVVSVRHAVKVSVAVVASPEDGTRIDALAEVARRQLRILQTGHASDNSSWKPGSVH
jgi:diguanylate cyclase (GGDEF)-like protein